MRHVRSEILVLGTDFSAKLNDIISLVVGLWAVKAAQKSSTDKYSFGVSITPLSYDSFTDESIVAAS